MNQTLFQSWAMQQGEWWCYKVGSQGQDVVCSQALLTRFDHPIRAMKDLTGIYHSPIIDLKIKELVEEPSRDVRFVSSYDTRHGKTSFQHRLQLYTEDDTQWVFAWCVDVTEMVMLEREIVDAQGRASIAHIYERQALLEERNRVIEESYRKQSRFLALLSHELRSPLLGVKSMVMHLKQHYADLDYLVERLRIINLTTEQMTFLVNDILTYSQTEFDSVVLHPKAFSLKQTFEYVRQLTKSIALDKNVQVYFTYVGKQDWVEGDSVRLSQILINLIVNAIKFTRVGGVTIEVKEEENQRFSFQVTDSGEGIPKEKLAMVFDPFVQFKTQGSTNALGSGLGLSVVKQLVDVMGGDIQVESKFGVGTTFRFQLTLPGAEGHQLPSIEEGIEEHDERVAELRHHAYRVLVVDDSRINRMVLSGFLKELGCSVEEAADGQEAWNLFQAQVFDFVFLDIQMPVMDGFEVMQHINRFRQEGRAQDLKAVFAVTAGGGEELIPKGQTLQSLGFEKWFVKPINQPQLMDLLAEPTEVSTLSTRVEEPIEQSVQAENILVIPEHLQPMVEGFIAEFNEDLTSLMTFVEQGEWREVKAKAHYLKGNCMVFQLEEWVELLRKVEQLAQSEQEEKTRRVGVLEIVENLQKRLKLLVKSRSIGDNKSN